MNNTKEILNTAIDLFTKIESLNESIGNKNKELLLAPKNINKGNEHNAIVKMIIVFIVLSVIFIGILFLILHIQVIYDWINIYLSNYIVLTYSILIFLLLFSAWIVARRYFNYLIQLSPKKNIKLQNITKEVENLTMQRDKIFEDNKEFIDMLPAEIRNTKSLNDLLVISNKNLELSFDEVYKEFKEQLTD